MDTNSILTTVGIILAFIIGVLSIRRRAAKQAIEDKASLAIVQAAQAAWTIDPANSSSPNYDPVAYDEWLSKQPNTAIAVLTNPRR